VTPRKTAKQLDLSQIYWIGQPRVWRERFLPPTMQKKQRAAAFLRDSPRCARKRAIEVCPCAEDGKHAIYLLTLRPGADPGGFSA
jgi:hypothetical protein